MKLTLEDNMLNCVSKLSEGIPGAISVLMLVTLHSCKIDPDSIFGYIGVFLDLDTLEIYGSRIWMLFKDVCKKNIVHFIGMLRAYQLGIISSNALHHAINNYGDGINVKDTIMEVRNRLNGFIKEDNVI